MQNVVKVRDSRQYLVTKKEAAEIQSADRQDKVRPTLFPNGQRSKRTLEIQLANPQYTALPLKSPVNDTRESPWTRRLRTAADFQE